MFGFTANNDSICQLTQIRVTGRPRYWRYCDFRRPIRTTAAGAEQRLRLRFVGLLLALGIRTQHSAAPLRAWLLTEVAIRTRRRLLLALAAESVLFAVRLDGTRCFDFHQQRLDMCGDGAAIVARRQNPDLLLQLRLLRLRGGNGLILYRSLLVMRLAQIREFFLNCAAILSRS